jgi:uncharacterized damage-inducible protein DinB
MRTPVLEDAFGHHVWATLRLIDACAALGEDQLATEVPGTFGSILGTMRHLVGADCSYLFRLTEGRIARIDEEGLGLPELRAVMERNGPAWSQLVSGGLDGEKVIVARRDDGSETRAPVGLRIAQALHHGTDHRSQVCTALTTLGVTPPEIDVWDFGLVNGRVSEVPPGA